MSALGDAEPIIIKKRGRRARDEHHGGGGWKVAFADFAVSMMAFFLVLWLSASTTVEEQRAISGYFEDPTAFEEGGSRIVIDMGGSAKESSSADSDTVELEEKIIHRLNKKEIERVIDAKKVAEIAKEMERKKFDALLDKLKSRIEKDPNLRPYRDQILLNVTDDGLQIQIIDRETTAMFDSGSSQIKRYTQELIKALSATINSVPNRISISGHTDAVAFQGRENFSNWELSAERANAARRTLVEGGYPSSKIAEVVGHASSVLFNKKNPSSARNRRISILVMSDDTEEAKRRALGKNEEQLAQEEEAALKARRDAAKAAAQTIDSSSESAGFEVGNEAQAKKFTTEKSEFRRGWNKIIPRSKDRGDAGSNQLKSPPATSSQEVGVEEEEANDEVF